MVAKRKLGKLTWRGFVRPAFCADNHKQRQLRIADVKFCDVRARMCGPKVETYPPSEGDEPRIEKEGKVAGRNLAKDDF